MAAVQSPQRWQQNIIAGLKGLDRSYAHEEMHSRLLGELPRCLLITKGYGDIKM